MSSLIESINTSLLSKWKRTRLLDTFKSEDAYCAAVFFENEANYLLNKFSNPSNYHEYQSGYMKINNLLIPLVCRILNNEDRSFKLVSQPVLLDGEVHEIEVKNIEEKLASYDSCTSLDAEYEFI
jgi:hypothetical protein